MSTEPASGQSDKPSLFRKEALEHHQRGVQPPKGDVLRLSPAWTVWAYWLLVAVLAEAFVLGVVGTISEYASGPALVRLEGRTDLTVPMASMVAQVHVQPGQRVREGALLVSFQAEEERSALTRLQSEFESHLVRYLRDPSDVAARQALTSLRAERELARTRLEARSLRAPFAGLVGDVRIQPGQYLTPGTRALSLASEQTPVMLQAFLPGSYRPLLRPGMSLRVELNGFRYAWSELVIESVGDQVIGPGELKRYLGPELADAVEVQGPIVLVKARLPSSFEENGRTLDYFDGMPARVEARVRTESILMTLIPGLKGLFSHGG
ncbi:efflux RND transporter periplasmic adaptor subunit [Archangium lansingense]|uniref:HlyD family efflux transporter periplasmic adaptor subunit n=1 Tax=Archangium lansingense TaxID=2995310 RepID=A0ABT4A806_9BACT|nr:HlyD family efflux transporter periplasmic adaptor subunit [Archangium lansinium]MCY1077790.1 HlyD family efflux transporter periplasmic adaptor subunit [Archangium lansinium]